MSRRKKGDLESEWFDCFARWPRNDRDAALRVLAALHKVLPDKPAAPNRSAEQPTQEQQPA